MELRTRSGSSRAAASSATARAAALRSADAERLRRYAAYLDFYNGRQWAKPRPNRTNLVVNYSRSIVDKGISYLLGGGVGFEVVSGLGFQVSGTLPKPETPNLKPAEELLSFVYEDNDLEAVDAQGAINGAVLGDTVFKVFWERGMGDRRWGMGDLPLSLEEIPAPPLGDSPVLPLPLGEGRGEGRPLHPSPFSLHPSGRGRIRVVNIDPFTFFPRWAADDPSTLLSVEVAYQLPASEWESGRVGEGEKNLTPHPLSHSPTLPLADVVEHWTDDEFVLTVGDREPVRSANPYGFIPFVHIPNVRPANEFWGVSDLRDVLPLNRELNERMSDMADVIRFHSDPPVVFKGVREHSDLAVGPGTVWDLPEGAEVELLEWRGQAPAVHDHIERVMRALHDVAETPKTAFGDSGRLLSGVALETELQPLIQKTLRKRIWWSVGLRRRNRYILRIADLMGLGSFAPYRTRVVWPALLPEERVMSNE